MQRLRVWFTRGEELAFISHLDMMRFWERALRRAGLPLSYSQGFSPHPRISLAAPLALGVTSEAELMDVYLDRWVPPHSFLQSLRAQMPRGIEVREAHTIPQDTPSLQSQVRFAEYRVELDGEGGPEDVPLALEGFLAADSIMWQHARDKDVRCYNLRELVQKLWLVYREGRRVVLGMRLRCDPAGAGRPEQVAAALGFPRSPLSLHRTRLVLEAPRGNRR
jgi:radical SAM-linked protein